MRKLRKRILGTFLALTTATMSLGINVHAEGNDYIDNSIYDAPSFEESIDGNEEEILIFDETDIDETENQIIEDLNDDSEEIVAEVIDQNDENPVIEDETEVIADDDSETTEDADIIADDTSDETEEIAADETIEEIVSPADEETAETAIEAEITEDEIEAEVAEEAEEVEEAEIEEEFDPIEMHFSPDAQIYEFNQTDKDALLASYIDSEIDKQQTPVYASSMSGDRLTGMNKTIYNKAKLLIGRVAAGQEVNTKLTFSFKDLGVDTKHYTASDLGVTYIAVSSNGNITVNYAAIQALYAKTGVDKYDSMAICNALERDNAYESYWINTISPGSFGYSLWRNSSGEFMLSIDGEELVYSFEPTSDYKGTENFTVDPAKTKAVGSTITNVNKIIEDAKSLSDYEKFVYYKNKIISSTDLDNSSSNKNDIVSVFDGNSKTNTSQKGYCRAFEYLCEKTVFNSSSVKCYPASGKRGAYTYYWSIVRLADGRKYMVDLAECDKKSSDKLFLALPISGTVSNGYIFECNGELFTYTYDEYTLKDYKDEELTLTQAVKSTLKGFSVNYPAYLPTGSANQFILVREGGTDKCKYRLDYVKKDGKNILGESYAAQFVDSQSFNITFPSEGNYEIRFTIKDTGDNNVEVAKIITVAATSENGLVSRLDGEYYYLKDGVIQSNFTGLLAQNGDSYYVQKGKLVQGVNGLTNVNGTWYYLKNSILQKNYTGLVQNTSNKNWYYVQKGELKWGVKTLVQYEGTWYYVSNSTLDWKFTGFCTYNKTDYYIQNGTLKWGVNGLVNAGGKWYYVKNSALQKDYTGLAQNAANKNWYYVQKGELKWGVKTLVQYQGTWYYVSNSTLDWKFTGICTYNGTDYYIQNGTLKWGVDGLTNVAGTWYYLKNSAVQKNYTGLVQNAANKNWYYVQKGKLIWGVKTVVQYQGTWYYVNNSTLDWNYTGLVQNLANENWYYVQKGTLKWGVRTLVQHNGNWYYVNNSTLDWSYTGLCEYNGTQYYIQRGQLKWGVNGKVKINGKTYTLKNSAVVK